MVERKKGAPQLELVPPSAMPVTGVDVQVTRTAPTLICGQFVNELADAAIAILQVSLKTPIGTPQVVFVAKLAPTSGSLDVRERVLVFTEKKEIRFTKNGAMR